MLENFDLKNNISKHIDVWAMSTTFIFLIACIFGEGLGGSLGANPSCYSFLGCTEGFMGYDALEHFLFGIVAVLILVWLFRKFTKYSLLHTERWKNVLTIIALVVFVSVLWEFLECAQDVFRTNILHETLVNWRLHINLLNQPSNIDTMGDLVSGLAGSIVALFFTKI